MKQRTRPIRLSLFIALLMLSSMTLAQGDTVIYEQYTLEVPPEFPGGGAACRNYIMSNLQCSDSDSSNFGGRVVLTFIVETDGSLSDIKIRYATFDATAECVAGLFGKMPRWSPGRKEKNGPPVRCRYMYPITCILPGR